MRALNLALCVCVAVVSECLGYYYPPVFWHYQNCVFRKLRESIGNETKEYFMKVLPHHKLRIVCPSLATVNDWIGQKIKKPYQNFYMVDKNGYDNCKVNDKIDPVGNKLLLMCDKSWMVHYKTLNFNPRYNLEEPRFIPGKHYYFIGTGNGLKRSLNSKSGGHCREYHMRLHIYVCDPTRETCIWEQPYCEPTYEFYREMKKYSRNLPPPTRVIAVSEESSSSTKHSITSTSTVVEKQVGDNCNDDKDGSSVHMILNFVLGGVILFMAFVIVILSVGLARKSSNSTRPASVAFSAISAQEPNASLYHETPRFIQPVYTPVSKSPPQTPISLNPPFYLAPMAEIRPRSASKRNGFNNHMYARRQDSIDVPPGQVDPTPLIGGQYASTPEPV